MHTSYFLNKSFWACQTIPRCEFSDSWESEKTDDKGKALVWPLPLCVEELMNQEKSETLPGDAVHLFMALFFF